MNWGIEVVRQVTEEVKVKKRKNGDFYANISKVETSLEYKTVSKTLKSAKGKEYKTVTLISVWGANGRNAMKIIWNE